MLSFLQAIIRLHLPAAIREKGQGLVEYALILVLVAIVVIAILLIMGPVVGNVFSNIVYIMTHTRAEQGIN
jgi:pilus assembly protein Flp/PilA